MSVITQLRSMRWLNLLYFPPPSITVRFLPYTERRGGARRLSPKLLTDPCMTVSYHATRASFRELRPSPRRAPPAVNWPNRSQRGWAYSFRSTDITRLLTTAGVGQPSLPNLHSRPLAPCDFSVRINIEVPTLRTITSSKLSPPGSGWSTPSLSRFLRGLADDLFY
jgi:hypothetical protein